MGRFVLSKEKPNFMRQEGFVIMPNGIIRIYRLSYEGEERRFVDGVLCEDLETVFEVIDELQAAAMKVRKNEKI